MFNLFKNRIKRDAAKKPFCIKLSFKLHSHAKKMVPIAFQNGGVVHNYNWVWFNVNFLHNLIWFEQKTVEWIKPHVVILTTTTKFDKNEFLKYHSTTNFNLRLKNNHNSICVSNILESCMLKSFYSIIRFFVLVAVIQPQQQ